VTLDPEVRDWRGVPSARITLNPHPADREMVRVMVDKGIEVLEAAGAQRCRGVDIGRITEILQGGTCRFGTDPAEAVLDPDCQAFDVPNLFVTDGSFMPTSGGVPITLTIMANAARVATRIVELSRRNERT
jgi:choline dehydrogenase-like flavoprotein